MLECCGKCKHKNNYINDEPCASCEAMHTKKAMFDNNFEPECEYIMFHLDQGAYVPKKAHESDAGFDIRTPIPLRVKAGKSCTVDTGLHVEIPIGYYGRIASKSGLNVNHNIVTEGVIDSGYTGSIHVKLYNHGEKDYFFNRGDKITQLIIEPIPVIEMVQVEQINQDTERGNGGFGSTGR